MNVHISDLQSQPVQELGHRQREDLFDEAVGDGHHNRYATGVFSSRGGTTSLAVIFSKLLLESGLRCDQTVTL